MRRSISARLRFKVLSRDGFTCQYCGSQAPNVELQIDHRVPVCRGGANEIENLVTACRDCNAGKASMDADPDGNRNRMARALECLDDPFMARINWALADLERRIPVLPGGGHLTALIGDALIFGVREEALEAAAKRYSDFESWEAWIVTATKQSRADIEERSARVATVDEEVSRDG